MNSNFPKLLSASNLKDFYRTVRRKPQFSEEALAERFVDEKCIKLVAGDGGDGASIFHRDKISEFGGPSGGSGGKGGDVILRADKSMRSLLLLKKYHRAKKGENGKARFMNGKSATDLIVNLPIGTRLRCGDTGEFLADLRRDKDEFIACVGGYGGKGNMYFKSSLNSKPQQSTRGSKGQQRFISTEMLLLADVGLVGFPNAGKSTLLRSLSRAKPLVAEYGFTTLSPHIGVIKYDDFERIAVADLPGLVENAHLNQGFGFKFLRHIERCKFVIYVCDMSEKEPWNQIHQLQKELKLYKEGLEKRALYVLANKMDLLESRNNYSKFCKEMKTHFPHLKISPISGKTQKNLEAVILKLREVFDECLSNDAETESRWWR